MTERPFDQIRDTFRENNKKNKELLKYVFEKSDNISLWIIGLSVGAISNFAKDIGKAKSYINPHFLSPILYLLAFSVASGIVYRILFLRFFAIANQTMDGIDISFERKKTMDTESLLKGNETYQELLVIVQNSTGENFSQLPQMYNDSDDQGNKILYDSMVSHYLATVKFAKRDTELAIDFAIDTYSKFLGISKEKYRKKLESSSSREYSMIRILMLIFYLGYILTFITALFL